MDTLTPLQTAQGKAIPKGTTRVCPIHYVHGRITDWKPPSGLDPLLREFKCGLGQHAFYEIVRRNDGKTKRHRA
jgi:hypothetical protein